MKVLSRAAAELNKVSDIISRVGIQHGDLLLFKPQDGQRLTNAMISSLLEVLSQRGIKDVVAMILGPDDTVETIPQSAFDEIARQRGYLRAEATEEMRRRRLAGRRDVLRLLEAIQAQSPEAVLESVVTRIKVAIDGGEHASRKQSPAESDGDSGAPPGEALQSQPEPVIDEQRKAARVCVGEGEGPATEEGEPRQQEETPRLWPEAPPLLDGIPTV